MDLFERLLRWGTTVLASSPICPRMPEQLLRSAIGRQSLQIIRLCRRSAGVDFDHYMLQFALILGCRQDFVATIVDDQLKHRERSIGWEGEVF